LLKTDYKEENTLDTNIKLAIKILVKTMDSTTPSPERIELLVMKKDANGHIFTETLAEKQVLTLIEEIQKEQELENKKAEAATGDI
jgi:20S proteasome subunit alpha 3